MGLSIKKIVHESLEAVFRLGDYVQAATFYRPAGFNGQTGQFQASEQAVACKLLLADYRPFELGLTAMQPGDEKVIIRAEELAGVTAPGPGDYLVDGESGQRWDIANSRLDRFGEFWTLQTRRSAHEDWGGLSAATVFADWGDLSAATEQEDYLLVS